MIIHPRAHASQFIRPQQRVLVFLFAAAAAAVQKSIVLLLSAVMWRHRYYWWFLVAGALVVWQATQNKLVDVVNGTTLVETTMTTTTTTNAAATEQWTMPLYPVRGLRDELEQIIKGGQGSNATTTNNIIDLSRHGCSPTSQIRIRIAKPSHAYAQPHEDEQHDNNQPLWILQSLDEQGMAKTVGGDEFYIAYFSQDETSQKDDPTAVATILDQNDGTYALDFITTPLKSQSHTQKDKKGTLHVFLQYTCGMGQLDPPHKESWQNSGGVKLHWTQTNVPAPPIRLFEPPNKYNLSEYSAVFFVGDSLFDQLARTTVMMPPPDGKPKRRYFRPHTYMADPIQRELTMATVEPAFLRHVVTRHDRDFQGLVPGLNAQAQQSTPDNIAVLIGSAVWDLLSSTAEDPDWENHLAACRFYVQKVQKLYPHITVFWKSGTAVHVHRLPADCTERKFCNKRTRYMSSSRAQVLYEEQKQLMESLNVPVLDLYEASYLSAYRSRPDDGRHYTDEWNDQMSKFLFGLDDG